jgi:hypothetical protein
MNLNQVGLIFNILGSVLIAISVFPVKANAYIADTNNKPIKPLAINHRLLYGGLGLITLGFIFMLYYSFL